MSEQTRPLSEDLRLIEALERDMKDANRAAKLTNQQLVEEILDKLPFCELDVLIEEACIRLDPEWPNRGCDKPLTEEDKQRIDRATEKAIAQINEMMESARG